MTPARAAAHRIRTEVERGRRLDRAFADGVEGLAARDVAFVHELTHGLTRLRGRIDHVLARYVDRGLAKLDPRLLEVLRSGAYQILHMDAVPSFAAVSESVDQAREVAGSGAAGLANAVLRRVAEGGERAELFPDPEHDPLGYLETWGSHPRWLLERWRERWDDTQVAEIVARNNRRPSTFLRSLGDPPYAVVERLRRAAIEATELTGGPGCVRLAEGESPARALAAVPDAIVQDPAAGWVTRYADVGTGTEIADLCAAPGGKALALSGRARRLIAADRSEARIRLVRENALRVGRAIDYVVADALRPPVRPVDVVLLDVPCSGTGTLARHPDARWRLGPDVVTELAAVQAGMLEAAWRCVRPGGLLVYATCTLEPEENESQVDRFLAARPEFGVEPTDAVPSALLDERGYLCITPLTHGTDGAFAARLRRTK